MGTVETARATQRATFYVAVAMPVNRQTSSRFNPLLGSARAPSAIMRGPDPARQVTELGGQIRVVCRATAETVMTQNVVHTHIRDARGPLWGPRTSGSEFRRPIANSK